MSTSQINETHDIRLKSWVDAANDGKSDFPIQNLPYGVFRRAGKNDDFHGGVAIGDQILDLAAASKAGLFSGDAAEAAQLASGRTLNAFMDADPALASALRLALSRLLREDSALEGRARACLLPMKDAEMGMPAIIGDYTDFFASVFHATNTGSMFRPDNPLLPNYKHVPIAYHGRASSIRIGSSSALHQFPRPLGQMKPADAPAPLFGPSRRMDYELEVGIWIGQGNALGSRIPVGAAEAHVFGLCLLNDWSARDLQAWEYQPLGPFLGKSFATSISAWVVPLAALEAARVEAPAQDPPVQPYLVEADRYCYDLTLAIRLNGMPISRPPLRALYWTPAQQLAHLTVNGASLRTGDLYATGTVSGPDPGQWGSLLELSWGGSRPIVLDD
ncbi:MAG TPA: fumarylacetoacetase, partial [Burkholderiales bacterium]